MRCPCGPGGFVTVAIVDNRVTSRAKLLSLLECEKVAARPRLA